MKYFRIGGFLFLSLAMYWPGIIILGVTAIMGMVVFDYLFLVYPGTDSDLEGYCPPKLAKTWIYSGKPSWAGIITKGESGVRGLYLVVPDTTDMLCGSAELCLKIFQKLLWIKRSVKAKAIALAGRMPGIFLKQGIRCEEPFVQGSKGTIFCIMETLLEVEKRHGLIPGTYNLVLAGVGYVGTQLMMELKSSGRFNTIGLDLRPNGDCDVFAPHAARQLLQNADVVIVMTGKGSEFLSYKKYLNPDCIIVDDTHPKIKEGLEEFTLYKVAVGIEGVRFFPKLPGYRPRWIPGCTVEAIVAAATGLFNHMTQVEFNEVARSLGFFAYLVR